MTHLYEGIDQHRVAAASTRNPGGGPPPLGLLALQRTVGNAAVARLLTARSWPSQVADYPGVVTAQRCGPMPCDCGPDERAMRESEDASPPVTASRITVQRHGMYPPGVDPDEGTGRYEIADESTSQSSANSLALDRRTLVQRTVTESVVSEPSPLRPRPSVCLVHLHGNEVNALRAAQALVPRCDVNLVHLSNTGRHIHISAQGSVCEADPNRIFSDAAIATLWPRWNPRRPCASDPVKADAIGQIAAFRDQQLWPAIRRCMGVPGTLDEEAAAGICREGAPIAAFHNNDPSPSIDILAYCPGPGGPPGCGGQLGSEARSNRATDITNVTMRENPHIEPGQDKDDFFLVTRKSDFDGLVAQGRNVVLQSAGVRDDGSLSVRFAFGRYANIEAELGGPQARNVAMGEEAIHQMGATCTPAGSGSGAGASTKSVQRQQPPHATQRCGADLPSDRGETSDALSPPISRVCPADGTLPVEVESAPGSRTVQRSQPQSPVATKGAVLRQDAGATPETGTQTEETDGILRWLRHLMDEVIRVLEQVGTSPGPLARDAPPRGLPATCRTFADQSGLDAAKARISSTVIGRMSDRDVISWIVGLSPPPTSVTQEATEQRDCMLAAIRAAARRRGSGIRLPSGRLSRSDYRSFAQQRAIWERKFNFDDRAHGGRPFDRVTAHARARCGSLLTGATRWDPDNRSHRSCWLSTLSTDERQREILEASSAPGISRHHWGTDFDLFDPDMNPAEWQVGGAFADEYSWLLRNASTYGFIQSFTPTSTFMTVGYIEERWHWSYYPAAQALLEFARGHQADIEARLVAEWGSSPQFSFVRTQWRQFMFNVNEHGWF